MIGNILHLVEHSPLAYLIFDSKSLEILDGNKYAKSIYMKKDTFPLITELFETNMATISTQEIKEHLAHKKVAFMWNLNTIMHTGELLFCNIEVRPIAAKPNLFFLIVTPQINDASLSMKDWVDSANKPIFMLRFSPTMVVGYANTLFYDFFQFGDDIFRQTYENSFLSLLCDESKKDFLHYTELMKEDLEYFDLDLCFPLKSNSLHYHIFAQKIYISGNIPTMYVEIIDIKKREELSNNFEEQEAFFHVLQDLSSDILFKIDISEKILYYREDFIAMFGLPAKIENFPESLKDGNVFHPDDLDEYLVFARKLMQGIGGSHEVRVNLMNGHYEKFRIIAKPWQNLGGNTTAMVGKLQTVQSITELTAQAMIDPLTSSLNKQYFEINVTRILSNTNKNFNHALLFVDLDDFKKINDTLGHTFGDFLLSAMGKRLKRIIRNHDLIGRVGGDEFVLFFQSLDDKNSVITRAQLLLDILHQEFVHDKNRACMNASIGIAFYPDHGESFQELYANADKALYVSKLNGKNIATVYSSDLT